jgi:hypothetical protein
LDLLILGQGQETFDLGAGGDLVGFGQTGNDADHGQGGIAGHGGIAEVDFEEGEATGLIELTETGDDQSFFVGLRAEGSLGGSEPL